MRKFLKVLSIVLLAFVGLFGGFALWGFGDPGPLPDDPKFNVPLADLRAAMDKHGRAQALNVENMGQQTIAKMAMMPWGGPEELPGGYSAYQIVGPDGTTQVVDAGYPEALIDVMPGAGAYNHEGYERVQKGLLSASEIYLTHAHNDHFAGAFYTENADAILKKLFLNPAQKFNLSQPKGSARRMDNLPFPDEAFTQTQLFNPEGFEVLAPGLAVIPASGHMPGHQIFYVATESHEFLLLGDLVFNMITIEQAINPPRFVSLILGENKEQVSDQIAALAQFRKAHPEVTMLPSHDKIAHDTAIAESKIGGTFVP